MEFRDLRLRQFDRRRRYQRVFEGLAGWIEQDPRLEVAALDDVHGHDAFADFGVVEVGVEGALARMILV